MASSPPGTSGIGGSGIVLIRYPYVPNLPNVSVLVVAGGGGAGSTNTYEGGAGGVDVGGPLGGAGAGGVIRVGHVEGACGQARGVPA